MGNVKNIKAVLGRWARGAAKLASEAWALPKCFVGFGLFWAWTLISLQNSLIAVSPKPNQYVEDGNLSWTIVLLCSAAAFFVLGRMGARGDRFALRRAYVVGVLLVPACLGNALCLFVPELTAISQPLGMATLAVGALATGVGAAAFQIEWARVFAKMGARVMTGIVLLGIVIGSLTALAIVDVHMLLQDFNEAAGVSVSSVFLGGMLAVLPPLSMLFLRHCGVTGTERPVEGVRKTSRIPKKLVATTFVMGISFGAMDTLAYGINGIAGFSITVIALSVGALAFFLLVAICRPDFNTLFYLVGLPAMALSWLFVFLNGGMLALGATLHFVSYGFLELGVWALITSFSRMQNSPIFLACSFAMCPLMVGRLLGAWFTQPGAFVARYFGAGLYALIAFMLVASALYLNAASKSSNEWGFMKPSNDDGARTLDLRCANVAAFYRLTQKEGSVLLYLARGRNKGYIANDLVLSPDTVKVHIRHIYQKLGVHSQQELMTLVERFDM